MTRSLTSRLAPGRRRSYEIFARTRPSQSLIVNRGHRQAIYPARLSSIHLLTRLRDTIQNA